MYKKICFALIALFLLFCSSVAQAATLNLNLYPSPGDAVYREMAYPIVKSLGHAGLCVKSDVLSVEIIHMQKTGTVKDCEKISFGDFEMPKKYWGAMYSGDSWAAKQRIKEANRLYGLKKLRFDFWNYKSFDSYKGRCDGFVSWCFKKSGYDILNDYHWSSSSPQMQWKAVSKMSYRRITADGEAMFKTPIVQVTGLILF